MLLRPAGEVVLLGFVEVVGDCEGRVVDCVFEFNVMVDVNKLSYVEE